MAQLLVLSIHVCPGLGISPLRTNIWLSFSRAHQDRPRNDFFRVFEKFETCFSKICAHSERHRNLLAGIFEILTFDGNITFPLSPVLVVVPLLHPLRNLGIYVFLRTERPSTLKDLQT